MSESLSQTAKILKLLKTNGSATNRELNRICYRYSARLLELRREGHVLVTDRIKDGLYRYTYLGQVDEGIKGHKDKGAGFTHHNDKKCCACPCREAS